MLLLLLRHAFLFVHRSAEIQLYLFVENENIILQGGRGGELANYSSSICRRHSELLYIRFAFFRWLRRCHILAFRQSRQRIYLRAGGLYSG